MGIKGPLVTCWFLQGPQESAVPLSWRPKRVCAVVQVWSRWHARKVYSQESLRDWLLEHIPGIAGTTIGTLVHPIVGAIAEATGKRAADALRKPPADGSDPP